MSALAPNPQTETGVGGASPPVAGDDFSQFYLPQQMAGLPAGPPAGAYTDSQYLADNAKNRATVAATYGTALKALGYTDPATGQFIPGDLINTANLTENQAQQQMQQADVANTQAMQQQGTLFSGIRGQQQALAEAPFLGQIAQTELQLPQDLMTQWQAATGAIKDYHTQDLLDLAAAAQRATPVIDTSPPATQTPAAAPAPAPAPAPSSYNPHAYVPGGSSAAEAASIQNAGYNGPVYMAQGGEVDQPTAAVIGEAGPETVVPHANLTADEQNQLSTLAATAQARAAATPDLRYPSPIRLPAEGGIPIPQRPVDQGYGPGGGLPFGPPPRINLGGPIHLQPPAVSAADLYAQGHHAAALAQWEAHHPGAMAGRDTAGLPHWALAAVHARLAAMHARSIGV